MKRNKVVSPPSPTSTLMRVRVGASPTKMDSTPSCSSAEDVNPTQLPFVKLKCSIPPPRLRLVYILMETGGIFRRASLFSLEGFSAKSCLT